MQHFYKTWLMGVFFWSYEEHKCRESTKIMLLYLRTMCLCLKLLCAYVLPSVIVFSYQANTKASDPVPSRHMHALLLQSCLTLLCSLRGCTQIFRTPLCSITLCLVMIVLEGGGERPGVVLLLIFF